MTEKMQPATGCWIDGHWGQWGITRLIEIAKEYGFVTQEDDELALFNYRQGDDGFIYDGQLRSASDWILSQGGLGDAAEEWLNKNIADEGFAFGWHESEFFYMDESWWEEQS